MIYVSWLLQDTWTDSFKSLPAAFKGHGTWCLFQCCFFMYFFSFLLQWPTVSEWGEISVFFFLRSPMRICVRVWSCMCSVLWVQTPSLIITWLLNCLKIKQNNVTRNSLYSWRYKRCHSRDQLIVWYRQNMHRLS